VIGLGKVWRYVSLASRRCRPWPAVRRRRSGRTRRGTHPIPATGRRRQRV
jgi:hypothetical protein